MKVYGQADRVGRMDQLVCPLVVARINGKIQIDGITEFSLRIVKSGGNALYQDGMEPMIVKKLKGPDRLRLIRFLLNEGPAGIYFFAYTAEGSRHLHRQKSSRDS